MNFVQFIRHEIKDRTSQKGLTLGLWNFVFFPVTLLMNYFSFRKWLKLLKNLDLDFTDLNEEVKVIVFEKKISFLDVLEKPSVHQANLNFNECYLIEKEVLFIFPYHKPLTKNDFFTEYRDPIVISFLKEKHPYQTLWKVSTLTKIQKLKIDKSRTSITLKGEVFDNEIELIFEKRISDRVFSKFHS